MIRSAWLWAASISGAAICSMACSAKTGTTGLPGNFTGAGGFAVGAGGARAGTAGFVSGSSSGGNGQTPLGPLGPGNERGGEKGTGPDGSCGELPFEAEQSTKTTTTTHEIPQPI